MSKITVLVTIDLESANSSQRTKFNEEMEKLNWKKWSATSTTWSGVYKEGTIVANAVAATKSEIGRAATAAQIQRWTAICLASTEAVQPLSV